MYLYLIIASCLWGVVWGIVTKKVIENKGYSENWFWWGFLFGIFALIVALTKPNCKSICATGSRFTNNEYILSRNPALSALAVENEIEKRKEEEKRILDSGGWKCHYCGAANPSFRGFCACGISRGENQKLLENTSFKETEENNATVDKFEEVKKYKELLKDGIISEEEFNAKKAEILEL